MWEGLKPPPLQNLGLHLQGAAVADVEAADPEEDVFGDVGGVICYALEVAGC